LYQVISSRITVLNSLRVHVRNVVVEELFTTLAAYEGQESLYIAAALEVIGYLGPNERSTMRLPVLKAIVCEPTLAHLQINCITTMLQLGYDGLCSAVDLATKDINGTQQPILRCVLQQRAV